MDILTTVFDTKELVRSFKQNGLRVGLVPTMGYLHAGHASLIIKALEENDKVVVSIFVNPTQFAPEEDLATYPRDFDTDKNLIKSLGAHAIFYPTVEEMYPQGFNTYVEVLGLTEGLCGRYRPTHFRGVTTVVLKLFNIVEPNRAYFGLKDAQQFFVLKRMVEDLNLEIAMVPCPIVRESDGLALSSRNIYLSPKERMIAPILHNALKTGLLLLEKGERRTLNLKETILSVLEKDNSINLDYLEVVDTVTLKPIDLIENEVLVALAARLGTTRLIDNFVYTRKKS